MAFTVIVVGDPVLASVAMGNWRNVNYGNALLPVDATGNGVNNTIAAGSSSYRFSNTYSVLGNFSGQITSTLTTGTAPFSIASTTKVANLNADFLDDQTGSYYQNSDNQSAGTLPTGRMSGAYSGITAIGGTGLTVGEALADITLVINGLSSSGTGSRVIFQRSGSQIGQIGSYAAASGGTSNDIILHANNGNMLHLGANAVTGITFDVSGDVGVLTNFYVDTNVLYVKPSTNQVFIGKSSGLAQFEIEGASSATLGTSLDAFIEGGGSNNTYTQLGFGWSNGSTKPPIIIGSKTVLDSGNTKSEFFIAVRDVTTDTAPTIAVTVKTTGNVVFGADVYTVALTDYSSTSTVGGWSGSPTKDIRYKLVGKTLTVYYSITGTSNSTSASFTLPYTVNSSLTNSLQPMGVQVDNGVDLNGGNVALTGGSATVSMRRLGGANFTTSGTKTCIGLIVCEIS